VKRIQRALLGWFSDNARDLPWRRTRDPYAVWISEVMLQQTQVSTVIPYWERFLARFPTVQSLAAATIDEVTPLWSGLGYYARCRNLHKAAQAVVERFQGKFPADRDALLELPGFGPYTAGAVGSIALGLSIPAVDGNVGRVFCRWEGWRTSVDESREQAWEVAASFVPEGQAHAWNQAVMELGATVCGPAVAKCGSCPVRAECRATARGEPTAFPTPKVRAKKKPLHVVSIVVREGATALLVKRETRGLFGGLWELPGVEVTDGDGVDDARALAAELLGKHASVEKLGRVEATLTHREVTVDVFEARGKQLELPASATFAGGESLRELGLSTLMVRVLETARVPVPEGYGRRRKVEVRQARLL